MAAADFRDRLLECLGGDWPVPGPLNVRITKVTPADGYEIRTLSYDAEPGDRIPALLLVPNGVTASNP
ncbi:MAG: hypothetical protein JNG89_04730, partial [Planctomycetaceae bacterium]|nr:hypothetical protein [Planctomycetaceae bacterium]